MKTVKMRFSQDMFYTDLDKPLYSKDMVHDVPENMRDRWLKRGGVLVADEAKVETKPVQAQEPVEPTPEKTEDDAKPARKPGGRTGR